MPQNFIACDREQVLLLPPDLRDWLPEDHLAWFVLDAVAEMDLSVFYGAYRADGHGRAAHDPAMMVALLLHAYAKGQCSSRGIERECVEDIAYRVIAANHAPDHATIARFRACHEGALAGLFSSVLGLCAQAGMAKVGVVAVDGTKVHANASQQRNRDYEQIAKDILAEADAIDGEEDERFGEKRGDELPPQLGTSRGRRGWLRDAQHPLDSRPKRLKRLQPADPADIAGTRPPNRQPHDSTPGLFARQPQAKAGRRHRVVSGDAAPPGDEIRGRSAPTTLLQRTTKRVRHWTLRLAIPREWQPPTVFGLAPESTRRSLDKSPANGLKNEAL